MRTWRELGEESPQQSWRRVRNLRAAPSAAILDVLEGPGRADVFHTGLEQAEQLFRAAAQVGRKSRPLLLFYGLGQAGRAVAAASDRLADKEGEWTGSGHGLKFNLAPVDPSRIWEAEVHVTPSSRDLFSRASTALHSAQDLGSISLGALAANLAEFGTEFPNFMPDQQLVYLDTVYSNTVGKAGEGAVNFTVRVPDGVDVEAFLQQVPVLADFPIVREHDGSPVVDHNGRYLLRVPVDELEGHGPSWRLKRRQDYRGLAVAVRAMGGSRARVHPLMVWWMVLYALSMLARYDPSKWHAVLDIRTSSVWSQVEYLQDRALDSVPDLLAEALETGGISRGES